LLAEPSASPDTHYDILGEKTLTHKDNWSIQIETKSRKPECLMLFHDRFVQG